MDRDKLIQLMGRHIGKTIDQLLTLKKEALDCGKPFVYFKRGKVYKYGDVSEWKRRADVAEEALTLACEAFYCIVNDKEESDEKTVNQLIDYFKEQAAERLKEKQ